MAELSASSRRLGVLLLPMLLLTTLTRIDVVTGHGRLIKPPSRACMWRYGYDTPKNYDDNQLFCGGLARQWDKNGGKCGICGDAYDEPAKFADDGEFATGKISGEYRPGEAIHITIEVTANHGGRFEFRLCPLAWPMREATESCLKQHRLSLANGSDSFRLSPPLNNQNFTTTLQLPEDVTCNRCVLQWTWVTANSWGCDEKDKGGKCCIGCGQQENFVNCADISILKTNRPKPRPTSGGIAHLASDYSWTKPTVLFTNDGHRVLITRGGAQTPSLSSLLQLPTAPTSDTGIAESSQFAVFNSGSSVHLQPDQQQQSSDHDPYSGQEDSVGTGGGNTGTQSDPYGGQDYTSKSTANSGTEAAHERRPVSVAGGRMYPEAVKSTPAHCELSMQLDGVDVDCERVCVPNGDSCNGKIASSIMDDVCALLCNVVM